MGVKLIDVNTVPVDTINKIYDLSRRTGSKEKGGSGKSIDIEEWPGIGALMKRRLKLRGRRLRTSS